MGNKVSRSTPKVILVNPSATTIGYSFVTPRWLYVIAQGTPTELVGDPVIVDEVIDSFDAGVVQPGDIVGIGINTGNCLPGYRVLSEAKSRGATVIVGGVHATIFPDEPLEMGADAVVTGNGDLIWSQVIKDALEGQLRKKYDGGRVPGDALLKARWELLDPARYMMPSIQTVAGCPENCSFCSVWVTDGRQPRQRLSEKIIEEANELYGLGYRFLVFADDNFNPATLGRIAREPSAQKRRELERIREERLSFFDDYDRAVPKNVKAFTQMTAEVISDEEYFSAMYHKMRIRTALVGVESFNEEGLQSAGKQWSPTGQKMVETIQAIQEKGILVLSSIICGLESDTVGTMRTMRKLAIESGSALAQFTFYHPYPGTKDYFEMKQDQRRRDEAGFVPKHQTQILADRFWLEPHNPVNWFRHATMSSEVLLRENKKCWDNFYSLREILKRSRGRITRSWSLTGRLTYIFISIAFHRVYAGHGVSADNVQKKKGALTKLVIRLGVAVYNLLSRQKKVRFRV
jgi:radical SAM superfamily enzyme YgiQ (UPF0313 family)